MNTTVDKLNFHYPILDRRLDLTSEELTQLELVGRVTESMNQMIDIINNWKGQLDAHELSSNISSKRKLSSSGNFTGTVAGKQASLLLSEVTSNMANLRYLANQFADGQTGLIVDGGFFEDTNINKNYDGGMF